MCKRGITKLIKIINIQMGIAERNEWTVNSLWLSCKSHAKYINIHWKIMTYTFKLKTSIYIHGGELVIMRKQKSSIHKEILISKNVLFVINEILKLVIQCIHVFKFQDNCERLLKKFWEDKKGRQYNSFVLHWSTLAKNVNNLLDKKVKCRPSLHRFLLKPYLWQNCVGLVS